MIVARVLLPFLLLAGLACKQVEGSRCQTSDDCEPPLVCAAGEPRVCRLTGSDVLADAAPLPDSRFDARLFDANLSPIDAAAGAVDAPVSEPDGPLSEPDAAEPDAAEPDAAE
jgi:hypothetical protein